MALSSTTGGQSSSTAGEGGAGCGGGSLQNSPSLTDYDDDDDDGATTSVSEDAGELACDLSQPSGPAPQSQSDVEDHPPSIQLEKATAAAEKGGGGGWANSHRRRKSARPQWHYEGTVLDKSQRPPAAAVNGTEDDPAAAWDADRGHRTIDGDDASTEDRDDVVCSEAGAPSRPVTSH